jgi:hypothetical protein
MIFLLVLENFIFKTQFLLKLFKKKVNACVLGILSLKGLPGQGWRLNTLHASQRVKLL